MKLEGGRMELKDIKELMKVLKKEEIQTEWCVQFLLF